ncbi:hypothetical protein pA_gene0034 [Vibrio phage 13VT501A]|nr:hypothetical protein pA_gene0034 [Vibrio phage 13VT501A]
MKIKRKKQLSHKQFCSVFKNREFSRAKKLLCTIYLVELDGGRIEIHERERILVVMFSPITTTVSFILSLFWYGLKDTKEIFYDHARYNPTFRTDDCRKGTDETGQLLKIAGWIP